jgi:glycosyltransferase involved in cell wall biosynthesis
MNPDPIAILWMAFADAENTNAQSLNAREIALRLDPRMFHSTFFYEERPDQRLLNNRSVQLVRLPAKRRTWAILRQMLGGHDLITYLDYSPASYLFVHSPRGLRRGAASVIHVEAPAGQLEGASRQLRFLHKAIVPRSDFHTAITDFVAREMESMGIRSFATLPVGVDTSRFVPRPAFTQRDVPTILFAGTVMERKGVLLLLDIAKAVPNARFLIAGAGRGGFENTVRSRIMEMGLGNVEMLGSQSQKRMLEVMQSSDIFVLPSHLEGIPKVTLEAAATGLPCVIFNSYASPSVVDGITGFQVGNLQEMISRVRLLAGSSNLRAEMGAAGVQHAKKFDWDVIAPLWQDAYLRMAGKPARLQPSTALRAEIS